jgi:hypothetical protein
MEKGQLCVLFAQNEEHRVAELDHFADVVEPIIIDELNLHWIVTNSIWLADKVMAQQIRVLYGRYEDVEVDECQREIVIDHKAVELEGLLTATGEIKSHFYHILKIKISLSTKL